MNQIRLLLLTDTLEKSGLALEVTNNITDIKGNKIIIKSTNVRYLLVINLVKDTMAQTPYSAIVEEDLPGLRVKIHLPAWMRPFVERDQIVKLITIHHLHPSLSQTSFHQYQPINNLDTGATLVYFTLDYPAQVYFARQKWKIEKTTCYVKP